MFLRVIVQARYTVFWYQKSMAMANTKVLLITTIDYLATRKGKKMEEFIVIWDRIIL